MDIQRLKQLKILVIGDSCEDVYHYGKCERLSPEAPVPVFTEDTRSFHPGMSSNVFSNLESLGLQVVHITNEEKIEKHRYIDSRFKQHLLRVDIGDKSITKSFDISMIDKECKYDAVVISDYNKGFLTRTSCSEICDLFRNKGVPVFVDSKKKDLSCFSDCCIKINEREFDQAEGVPKECQVIVTLGSQGALYDGEVYEADQVEVFDVCGAGDVFLSALVSFFLLTNDIKYAIIISNKCASLSVTKIGTYTVTKRDIYDICF
jgi:bifunctional ADP-heptose synthase (sugar kinase/adenylyltransferase)